jgi:hypothetical protein
VRRGGALAYLALACLLLVGGCARSDNAEFILGDIVKDPAWTYPRTLVSANGRSVKVGFLQCESSEGELTVTETVKGVTPLDVGRLPSEVRPALQARGWRYHGGSRGYGGLGGFANFELYERARPMGRTKVHLDVEYNEKGFVAFSFVGKDRVCQDGSAKRPPIYSSFGS